MCPAKNVSQLFALILHIGFMSMKKYTVIPNFKFLNSSMFHLIQNCMSRLMQLFRGKRNFQVLLEFMFRKWRIEQVCRVENMDYV